MLGEFMARKYEFKPDKLSASLLEKLYITPLQRKLLLKWGLYAVLLVILSVLQDVIFCRMDLWGATTDLVPCGIFLICIIEGVDAGGLFCLIASAIYFFSGTATGAYCIPFMVIPAVIITVFRQSYLQKGFGAAILCTTGAMLVYELLVFATGLFLKDTYFARIGVFFLTGALSVFVIPVLYPLCKCIGKIGGEIWKE